MSSVDEMSDAELRQTVHDLFATFGLDTGVLGARRRSITHVERVAGDNASAPSPSDLLIEMWKRGLAEAETYACRLMVGADKGAFEMIPDSSLYDVVEVMLGCFDEPVDGDGWVSLAQGYDERILEALLTVAVKANRRIEDEVTRIAVDQEDWDVLNKLVRCVVRAYPRDVEGIQGFCLGWASDERLAPRTRADVFVRLAEEMLPQVVE